MRRNNPQNRLVGQYIEYRIVFCIIQVYGVVVAKISPF
jgi:hypothetical protein